MADAGARTILITGCSSGIGRDAALALHARGWRVFASCRAAEDCAALRAEGLESPRLDHEDEATVARAMDEVLAATGGRLDAVYLNGAYAVPGLLEDVPEDAMRAIFQANLIGWHAVIRRAIPVMRAARQGRIVLCSSVLGFVAAPWRGAYVATKYALEGYADTLRLELAGSGAHVALIQPGPIRSAFRANALAQFRRWIDAEASPNRATYAALVDRYASDAPARWELPASAVTAALIRALDAPRPRARYPVTVPTRMAGLMRRALPDAALDWTLRRS
jgi:NAD(P)-dependent dehydrogenase (short-subunit alcohol dehydrogenase family)